MVSLILKACASPSLLTHGKALHAESVKAGADRDLVTGTSLLDMYAKCHDIVSARRAFDLMPQRNVVTYNAMVGGYLKNGDTESASVLFESMPERTAVTWIEMISGFARCGDSARARWFFDRVPRDLRNVVTWTVMVHGYASNGEMEAAREVFEEMPHQTFFTWSSMVSGYFKRGSVREAREIFDRIPVRNLVNWNSLVSGYAQNGHCEEALEAFGRMQAEGFKPDEFTIVSVLSACAQLGHLDVGKEIHNMIIQKGIKLNLFTLNALVDMYAKCGDLTNARLIFDRMPQRNGGSWNAMISGFAIHGRIGEALEFFGRMEDSDEKPDAITFVAVLSGCAHGGFVKEGLEIYSKMKKYGLVAWTKHYGCLVDLLGRAGQLREAYDLIKKMPIKPNDVVWGALLGACRIHSDTDIAQKVMEEVGTPFFNQGIGDDSHCLLLSNIYAACDKWESAERMRIMTVNGGVLKMTAHSTIHLSTAE